MKISRFFGLESGSDCSTSKLSQPHMASNLKQCVSSVTKQNPNETDRHYKPHWYETQQKSSCTVKQVRYKTRSSYPPPPPPPTHTHTNPSQHTHPTCPSNGEDTISELMITSTPDLGWKRPHPNELRLSNWRIERTEGPRTSHRQPLLSTRSSDG